MAQKTKSSAKRRTSGRSGANAKSRASGRSGAGTKSGARAKSRTGDTTRKSDASRAKTAKRASASKAKTPRAGQARGAASPLPKGNQLSKSTLRAKWIDSPDEHEDYPGQTLATRNHDVIRRWAEGREAQPAAATVGPDGRPRTLVFDFPGYGGQNLQHISWDDWFQTFDERQLVFLFQEHLKSGRPSNFFRLDSAEREAA